MFDTGFPQYSKFAQDRHFLHGRFAAFRAGKLLRLCRGQRPGTRKSAPESLREGLLNAMMHALTRPLIYTYMRLLVPKLACKLHVPTYLCM